MARPTYRLYVIDSSITGGLRSAVMKAIDRSAPPGSLYVVAPNFQNFVQTMGRLSSPAEIQQRGQISDVTFIAHGGVAGAFHLGRNLVGHDEFNSIAAPFAALAPGAHVDVIRCASALPSNEEDRRSLYKTVAQTLLPAGGRVGGTADDVEFSDGGGARLMRGAAPIGGRYPTAFHSLELLKQIPQEAEVLTTHTVRFGDRFWHLSRDFGFGNPQEFTNEIITLNPGIDFTRLRPGQRVTVPTRRGPAPPLSPPWALRQRQAMRGGGPEPAPDFGALQQMRSTLEHTPWPQRQPFGPFPLEPHPAGTPSGTIEALQQLEHAAQERERQQQWLDGIRDQLERRPAPPSIGGTPSFLRSLGQGLDAPGPVATSPVHDMSVLDTLGRLERQAQQREQTDQWLTGVQQQLDRRPPTGMPSTLAFLGRHLERGPQPWQPPTSPFG